MTLNDQDDAAVAEGLARIRKAYEGAVSSGRIDAAEVERRSALVTGAVDLATLADADLVVEAVFEDMAVKEEMFRRLDAVAKPGALLATNTSYLDVDRIAAATNRPQDVLGLHFFSPAQVMRLLEVVRAAKTSPEALATALAVGRRLRKLAVVAKVSEGFIGNRLYAAYRRQCEFMVEEGALPEEVDAALEAFGFAMGPFAVADMAGLDIAWRMRQRLAATRDPRERYCAIADRLCEQGRLGRKTGAGCGFCQRTRVRGEEARRAVVGAGIFWLRQWAVRLSLGRCGRMQLTVKWWIARRSVARWQSETRLAGTVTATSSVSRKSRVRHG